MLAAKKRKVTTTTSRSNPSSLGAITTFTKVSRSQVVSKWTHEKGTCSAASQLFEELGLDRKRKLLVVKEVNIDAEEDASAIPCTTIGQSHRDVKPLPARCSKELQRLPQTPRKPIIAPSNTSSAETPTKGTRGLLDGLVLSSSSSKASVPSSPLKSQKTIATDDKASFPEPIIADQPARPGERLPVELLDLINLHSSFLTALSLHHAHNGAHSPADLRLLCPDVARAWGKRKVILQDIQRILAVLSSATADANHSADQPLGRLSLSDYGHGKICVEVKTAIGKRGKMARPLEENRLNDAFTSHLQKSWTEYQDTEDVPTPTAFMQTLPLETISICSSLTKMSPLLAKGQRRLEDLKAGLILKNRPAKANATASPNTAPPPAQGDEDARSRKPTLLERLKAKEQHRSAQPAPPSKTELSRVAALHRLEEVVSVLTLLTTATSIGQQRVSFTLPTVLGKLRDSFKTPLSREEGEACVRLLAEEVAPEWLRVVRMGKVDAVVVNRDCRPSGLDVRERVRRAV